MTQPEQLQRGQCHPALGVPRGFCFFEETAVSFLLENANRPHEIDLEQVEAGIEATELVRRHRSPGGGFYKLGLMDGPSWANRVDRALPHLPPAPLSFTRRRSHWPRLSSWDVLDLVTLEAFGIAVSSAWNPSSGLCCSPSCLIQMPPL